MFKKNIKNVDEEKRLLLGKCDNREKFKQYGDAGSSTFGSDELGSTDSLGHPYPTAVVFVLLSKTFEATAANGIRSILSLYLRDSLMFTERHATIVLHIFNFFSQFLPIVGAIIADSYIGNAKTIFYFYFPYLIGYVLLLIGTFPQFFMIHEIIYTSLLMIAIGNGCLRACITALGAHQFKLPQQKASLDRYFSAYYFFYYTGMLMGKILPPFVRKNVLLTPYCQEIGQCYTSVFLMIALVIALSWVIFLCGVPLYKKETPTRDNTMLKTFNCVSYAAYRKISGKTKGTEWINGAVGRYSKKFVNDVAIFLKVVKLFLPIPIFDALLAQQDSTWTFQATLTDTTVLGYKIEPDQFKAIGPILLLMLIPLWQKIIQPFLLKFEIHLTSLECVFIGGLFASLSFVCAGFLQYFIINNLRVSHSILWQFPQFLFIMIAEMLISVPGLKFAYTNAPTSMKSVLTAIFFINNALGNLLVVVITQLRFFSNDSMQFFFYAFLMLIGTISMKIMSERHRDEIVIENDNNSEVQSMENLILIDEIQSTNLEENCMNFDEEICNEVNRQ